MRTSFQQGSIVKIQRKSGECWRFRWRQDGIQRSEFIGTVKQFPTRAQAEKAAERFRKFANSDAEVITIADLIAKFWRDCPPGRETTAASYRSVFKRIEFRWGNLRIDQFCRDILAVEVWLKELPAIGRHPGKGVPALASPLYRGQVRNLLHLLIEKAMLWNHLQMDRNPLDLIRLKGASKRAKDLVILTVDQYQQLLDDPQLPELVKTMVHLAAGLGLRVSEILGLRWDDCDFEAKTIQIQRSVVHGMASDTKTDSSRQTLPLHEVLIDVLKAWKAGEKFRSRWVFCSERTSRPYDRDWLRAQYLQPAGERIGVDGFGWHSLRHFYRAMLRQGGTPLEIQKNLMRHSRLATTMDTYGGNSNLETTRPANARIIEMLARKTG